MGKIGLKGKRGSPGSHVSCNVRNVRCKGLWHNTATIASACFSRIFPIEKDFDPVLGTGTVIGLSRQIKMGHRRKTYINVGNHETFKPCSPVTMVRLRIIVNRLYVAPKITMNSKQLRSAIIDNEYALEVFYCTYLAAISQWPPRTYLVFMVGDDK